MSAADIPRDLFKAAMKNPKSKSSENVAAEGLPSEPSKEDVAAFGGVQPKDSDSASILSNTLSMRTSNSSVPNLTATTTAASTTSPGPSQQRNTHAMRSEANPTEGVNQQLEKIFDTGNSINNIIATGVKSPMNFCMGLARGFRNAPNLYNDDTIRPTEKVTSFSSGLKVAGKEFGFGLFDGITGLVTQPLKGAEKEGSAGLLKGFGKGIGGLILKPAAGKHASASMSGTCADNIIAVWALPAYTMAGVHAEIRTMFAQSAHKYIVASRISQGNQDFNDSSNGEREDIEARWHKLKDNMKGFYTLKQKEKGKSRDASPSAPQYASVSTENFNKVPRSGHFQDTTWRNNRAEGPFVGDLQSGSATQDPSELHDDFETAILAAVHGTSRGDAAEDARIEQAIRSSLRVIGKQSTTMGSNPGASDFAAQAAGWVPDVKHPIRDEKRQYPFSPSDLDQITDEEYQALIEEAIKLSITESQQPPIHMYDGEGVGGEDDDNMKLVLEQSQTERAAHHDDEEYKKALEASQAEYENTEFDKEALRQAIEASQAEQQAHRQPDDDDELKRALEESEKAHHDELARISSIKSEEDIVLEYVKKQSLAEAAFRTKAAGSTDTSAEAEEDDEELRRALEESMKTEDGLRRGGGGGPSQPHS